MQKEIKLDNKISRLMKEEIVKRDVEDQERYD